ncbi:unnamed protein product [Peniophora sp. CBMAI 1063]|nr:unnamed protein product [Peniophora sp. CBMAI 1063]
MLKIRENMQRTQLPTCADKVPLDWGTKGHGRVTGGQWLVIGTVHLPITLIPLWGHPSAPQYERELLRNLMTMVSVVCIGTLRVVKVADTYDFDAAVRQYFEGKKRLFKDETIRPYDHLLLHYGDVLRGFGPTAAHDGSFYERHIRRLHSFNINMKSGELEGTYMRSAGRHANLRSVLLDDTAASTLSHVSGLVEEFRRQTFVDTRGTRLGSLMLESVTMSTAEGAKFLRKDASEVVLSPEVLDLLRPFLEVSSPTTPSNHKNHVRLKISNPASALSIKAASFGGARYCPASEVECDSDMIYSLDDNAQDSSRGGRLPLDKVAAGRIMFMFLLGDSSILSPRTLFGESRPPAGSLWVVIRPYQVLGPGEEHLDAHYRAEEFGGFCCKPEFQTGPPILLKISRILCQVAKFPTEFAGVPLLHFLPLARLTNAMPRADAEVLADVLTPHDE